VACVALEADGRRLAAIGHPESNLLVWDVEAEAGRLAERFVVPHARCTEALAFAPDGKSLAAPVAPWGSLRRGRTEYLAARTWDAVSGRELASFWGARPQYACVVAFSPDGRVLATGDPDGKVLLYDAATGTPLVYPVVYHAGVRAAAFCACARCLAVGEVRGAVSVTDVTATRQAFWNALVSP